MWNHMDIKEEKICSDEMMLNHWNSVTFQIMNF